MTESIERFWDDDEESMADAPPVDDLEAVEDDEETGDAINDPPSGFN